MSMVLLLGGFLLILLVPCFFLAPGLLLGLFLNRSRPLDERILVSLPFGFALPALLVPWSRLLDLPFKEIWVVLAAGSLVVLAWRILEWRRRPEPLRPAAATWPLMTGLALLLLLLAYLGPIWRLVAPQGQDMALHLTMARLIFTHGSIPQTFDPIYPGVPLGIYPLGFHALVSLAAIVCGDVIRGGLLMTALSHWLVPVALYVALKREGRDLPTALVALLVAWLSRNPQAHIGWGGNPSVLGTALTFVALRWVLAPPQLPFRRQIVGAVVLAASVPLVHSAAALIAVYLAPILLAVLLVRRTVPACARTWGYLAIVSGAAALLVAPQVPALFQIEVSAAESAWLKEFYANLDPTREGLWHDFGAQFGDGLMIVAMVAAATNLIVRKQRRWDLALLASLVLLEGFAWLASQWVLPGRFALYPERVMLFALPVYAVILRRFWDTLLVFAGDGGLRRPYQWRPRVVWTLLVGLLLLAGNRHMYFFTNATREHAMIRPVDLEAFAWIEQNLPAGEAIENNYFDAGVFLPAFSGRAVTRPQSNPVWFEEMGAVFATLPQAARFSSAQLDPRVTSQPVGRIFPAEDILFLASDGPDTARVVRPRDPNTGDTWMTWFD